MTDLTTVPELAHRLDMGAPDGPATYDGENDLRFEWVQIRRLSVDSAYQRLISTRGRAKIRKIVSEFDWARFGALQVAEAPDGATLSVVAPGWSDPEPGPEQERSGRA